MALESPAKRSSWAGLVRIDRSSGDLLRSATARAFRAQLDSFLRWWSKELRACLPARWRRRLLSGKRRFFVSVQNQSIRLVEVGATYVSPDRTISLNPQSLDDIAYLADMQRMIRKKTARLHVLVAEESVLRRRIRLPVAALENLREVLGFELDRHTPFESRDVYFDYSVVETDRESKTVTVDVAVVPRTYLDDLVGTLRKAGLPPRKVSAWSETAKVPDATFLKVGAQSGAKASRVRAAVRLALVLALDAAAAYVPLGSKLNVLDQLHAQLSAMRPAVEEVARLDQRLNELRNENVEL